MCFSSFDKSRIWFLSEMEIRGILENVEESGIPGVGPLLWILCNCNVVCRPTIYSNLFSAIKYLSKALFYGLNDARLH